MPDYISFKEMPPMSLKNIFSAASDDTLHLLENCLRLNPVVRFTATQVCFMILPIKSNDVLLFIVTQITILHQKASSLPK